MLEDAEVDGEVAEKPTTGLQLALKPSVWRRGTGMQEGGVCCLRCCAWLALAPPPSPVTAFASLPGGEELQVPTLLPSERLELLDRLMRRASEGEGTQQLSGGVGVKRELGGVVDTGMLRAREGCLPSGSAGVGRRAAMHSARVCVYV